MCQLIDNNIEILESDIYKLSMRLHEYIYLNDSYDSEIIRTIAYDLKLNIDTLLEITYQNNKD